MFTINHEWISLSSWILKNVYSRWPKKAKLPRGVLRRWARHYNIGESCSYLLRNYAHIIKEKCTLFESDMNFIKLKPVKDQEPILRVVGRVQIRYLAFSVGDPTREPDITKSLKCVIAIWRISRQKINSKFIWNYNEKSQKRRTKINEWLTPKGKSLIGQFWIQKGKHFFLKKLH